MKTDERNKFAIKMCIRDSLLCIHPKRWALHIQGDKGRCQENNQPGHSSYWHRYETVSYTHLKSIANWNG